MNKPKTSYTTSPCPAELIVPVNIQIKPRPRTNPPIFIFNPEIKARLARTIQ